MPSAPTHLQCPFCPSVAFFTNAVFKNGIADLYRFQCNAKHIFYLQAQPEEEP